MNAYGTLQRRLRLQAGRTLGEVARALGFSVSYVSDVELGSRAPFGAAEILHVADYLGVSPDELLGAAILVRGHLEVTVDGAAATQAGRFLAVLAREVPRFTSDDFAAGVAFVASRRAERVS